MYCYQYQENDLAIHSYPFCLPIESPARHVKGTPDSAFSQAVMTCRGPTTCNFICRKKHAAMRDFAYSAESFFALCCVPDQPLIAAGKHTRNSFGISIL